MTTQIFQGIYYAYDNNDALTEFRSAYLNVVTVDGTPTFSYHYDAPQVPGVPTTFSPDAPETFQGLYFDGQVYDPPRDMDSYLVRLTWDDAGTTRTSYVLTFDILDAGEYAFRVGGDAIPVFADAAEFAAFNAAILSVTDVPAGNPLAAGQDIAFAGLPNVTSTEDDWIYGTSGDDSLLGGVGNDQLFGADGDDYLNPGDNTNYDYIDTGRGNDTVDFGALSTGYVDLVHWSLASGIAAVIDGNANTGSIAKGAGNGATQILDVANPILSGANIGGLGIHGTNFADSFDVRSADGGWMMVNGYDGVDSYTIRASDGALRLDFRGAAHGITANFAAGQILDDGWGNAETVTGAQNVTEFRGTDHDDSIRGTETDERMILRAGDDTADGAGGWDILRYNRSGVGPVDVNLGTGIVTGTWNGTAFTHHVSNFEEVWGTVGADSMTGSDNDDNLWGAAGNDTLVGGLGDDSLYGAEGDNALYGGAGDDYLVVYEGNSTVTGGADYDDIEVRDDSSAAQVIDFAAGTIQGRGNADGSGSVLYTVTFTGVERVVSAHAGQVHATGSAGRDVLKLAWGLDFLGFDGGAGTDQVQLHQVQREDGSRGYSQAEFLAEAVLVEVGGSVEVRNRADDSLMGLMTSVEEVRFTDGTVLMADLLATGSGATDGPDSLTGTAGADLIDGLGGDDTIEGLDGPDTLRGNTGNDLLVGGNGHDSLGGGEGDDTLRGGAGNDTLLGGGGRDLLEGGDGDDVIDASGGGAGDQGYGDIVQAGTGTNTVTGHAGAWAVGSGLDMIFTDIQGTGIDLVVGANGSGTATSRSGTSVATSFTFADHYEGTHQADRMEGGSDGIESWVGEGGDDTIIGGGGWDLLQYQWEDGATQGVFVDLAAGTATDGFGDTDSLSGIEGASGGAFDDTLRGDGADNWLGGDAGNDTLRGLGGNDVLEGADGNDDLDGGAGNDTLDGGLGDDLLRGGDGDDLFLIGTGADSFYGNGGNDTLRADLAGYAGAAFAVRIDLAAGLVQGLDPVSFAPLPNGADVLAGIENAEVLNTVLSARITGDTANNRLESSGGADTLDGGAGFDTLLGGDGDDRILGGTQGDLALGGTGADTILGNDGFDTLSGEDGDDRIEGHKGNDLLYGGDGDDTIYGNIGDDTVFGGNGQDQVWLGAGNDRFEDNTQGAPDNNDTVWGEDGDDLILGGNGFDVFYGGAGADYIRGGKGFDSLYGGDQSDTIEGNDGNDLVYGGKGADQASLGKGADLWWDDAQAVFGDDVVWGGGGWDTLHSLGGDDTLTGGAGSDRFVFHAGIGDMVITDYAVGEDRLAFDTSLWSGPLTQGELDLRSSLVAGDLVLTLDIGGTVTFEGVASTAGMLGDIGLI